MSDRRVYVETDDDDYDEVDDGLLVNVIEGDDGFWAEWLQAGVGARADSRTGALRALADTLDTAAAWSATDE